MTFLSKEARALLGKELRQVRRSRGAMLSATLLPILLMVLMPMGQYATFRASGEVPMGQSGVPLPPGIAEYDDPIKVFTHFLLPISIVVGGLIVPPMAATYTIVAERERRSIELLIALPLRVQDILVAKLIAMVCLAIVVVLPLFALDAGVLLALGAIDAGHALTLLVLLLSALVCSVGCALLVALIARDLRTANNVSGAMLGPLILAVLLVLGTVPGDARLLIVSALLVTVGAAATWAGLRWLTFERYLA